MAYEDFEISTENGQPIELYLFKYKNSTYAYTSAQKTQSINIDGNDYTFTPEYIKRSDSLVLEASDSQQETCIISMSRTSNVALLFKGAPPEEDTLTVEIFRLHGKNVLDYIRMLRGTISQVVFQGSEAQMTIIIENVLIRNIPRGKLGYYCQNCIYDSKCRLDYNNYGVVCWLDGGMSGLTLTSSNLMERESGYFTEGYMIMGSSIRQIAKHENNRIIIKYPIAPNELKDEFRVYPGCGCLFSVCASRFGNTDNFSGIPYQTPYDAYYHPVSNRLPYWVDGNIVYRDTGMRLYTMNL